MNKGLARISHTISREGVQDDVPDCANSPRERGKYGLVARLFLCLTAAAYCLYSYLDTQNQLTQLRLNLPDLALKVRRIQEENAELRCALEALESPSRLMQLARQSEFAHLKFPKSNEVLTMRQAAALNVTNEEKAEEANRTVKLAVVQ